MQVAAYMVLAFVTASIASLGLQATAGRGLDWAGAGALAVALALCTPIAMRYLRRRG